jgi:hypothetical protein
MPSERPLGRRSAPADQADDPRLPIGRAELDQGDTKLLIAALGEIAKAARKLPPKVAR